MEVNDILKPFNNVFSTTVAGEIRIVCDLSVREMYKLRLGKISASDLAAFEAGTLAREALFEKIEPPHGCYNIADQDHPANGSHKLAAIRAVRAAAGCGLREAKNLVDLLCALNDAGICAVTCYYGE